MSKSLFSINNTKITFKLTIVLIIVFSGFTLFSIAAFDGISKIKINGNMYNKIILSKDLVADILPPPEYIIESYLAVFEIINESSPVKIREKKEYINNKLKKEYLERLNYWKTTLPDSEIKELLTSKSYNIVMEFYSILDTKIFSLVESGNKEMASEILKTQLKTLYNSHREIIDNVVMLASLENKRLEKLAADEISSKLLFIQLIAAGTIFISIIIFVIVLRSILSPINRLLELSKDLAEGAGDLTKRLEYKYNDEIGEISEYLNKFIGKLEATMIEVVNSSHRVASYSLELASGMRNVAVGAVNQSAEIDKLQDNSKHLLEKTIYIGDNVQSQMASIEETSSAMSVISHASDSMAKNAENTIREAENSEKAAEIGVENVIKIVAGMKNIEKAVGEIEISVDRFGRETIKDIGDGVEKFGTVTIRNIENKATKLGESSEKIGEIIRIIESIAEQTNLLALNAAIEAAHAGDAGRGFSVVADEIKALAERSKKSTKQIENLTKTIQTDVDNMITETKIGSVEVDKIIETTKTGYKEIQSIMKNTKVGYSEVSNGIVIATDAERQFKLITEKIDILNSEVINIAKSIEEHAESTHDINQAMANIAGNGSKIEDYTKEQQRFIKDFLKTIDNIVVIVQTGTASTEEISASTDELANIADNLIEIVKQFKVSDNKQVKPKS